MPRKKLEVEEPAAPVTGSRLPTMGAEASLGPATRFYRSPMTAGVSGGSAVVLSQFEEEGEAQELSDEPVEVIADEGDDVAADADADDDDGGDDDDDGGDGDNTEDEG